MCQIIIKPKGLILNLKHLEVAQKKNSHGQGVMWYDEKTKTMHVYKSLDFEAFKDVIIHKVQGHSAVIHLRLASKGGVSLENVHPFKTSRGAYLCHNGTLTSWGTTTMSDTLEFANTMGSLNIDWHNPAVETLVSHIIGTAYNKVVVMMPDGFVKIFNESLFVKEEGIYYSNTSHHEYIPPKAFDYKDYYSKRYPKEEPKQGHWWDDEKESRYLPLADTVKVFVYGTLMMGGTNNSLMNGAKYLGDAKTFSKMAMVDSGHGYPYLLGEHKDGHFIKGEVWEVDEDTKEILDILEGVPLHYLESEIKVLCNGKIETCIAYTKSDTTKYPSRISTYSVDKFIDKFIDKAL